MVHLADVGGPFRRWRRRSGAPLTVATARAIVDHSPEAIVAVGPDGVTVTAWNAEAERLLGWSASEIVGRPLPTNPLDSDGQPEELPVGTGPSLTQVECKDGSRIAVRIDPSELRDDRNRLLGWMGIVTSATAEQAAALALSQRVRLAERLTDASAALDSDLDVDSVLRRVVKAAVDLVDADAAAFITIADGDPVVAAVHNLPESLVGFRYPPGEGLPRQAIATRGPLVIRELDQYPYLMPSMREIAAPFHTVVCVPVVLRGTVSGVLNTLFSEGDRAVSQTAIDALAVLGGHAATALANAVEYDDLVRRRAHEQAVVDALADGVAVVDRSGVVTQWNRSAAEMTGLAADEAIGHPMPLDFSLDGSSVENHLEPDRWIEVIATPLPGARETVLALRDITAQKALEEAKSLFLATTSHELKTPLTVIAGFTSTLLKRWDELDDGTRRAALESINRRAATLRRLVERLLVSARVDARALTLARREFDLVPALRAAVEGFDQVSDRHDLAFALPESLEVYGDRRTIEQIMGHLLENAIKYSPAGGTVRVEAEATDGFAVIRVADPGVGITPREAERVWERFYQGGTGQRVASGGVGLGLYIVRSLVEAQGGSVAAYPCPEGPGSVFEFTLPLTQ